MEVAIERHSFLNDPHCGDQCTHWELDHRTILCMVDGLGHGEEAEKASVAAVDYVGNNLSETLEVIFSGCNKAIRSTRGVAMGIAFINAEGGSLVYAGIGNTTITILRARNPSPPEKKIFRLASDFGIVGGGYRQLVPKEVELRPGDLVVLATDGIREPVSFEKYDDALFEDIEKLAWTIHQDWRREMDDAAVMVYRNGSG